MRLFTEYAVIIVVAIFMTAILKKIEMNDFFLTFIATTTALVAGRLSDLKFYKKKKD